MPGLRVRADVRYTSPGIYYRTISYSFMSNDGTSINLSASDTSAPFSGVIQTDGVTWSLGSRSVGLPEEQQATNEVLLQNRPNPFNASTMIYYSTSTNEQVNLRVYNSLGVEVAELVNKAEDAGLHNVLFDASRFAPGNYYYTLRSGNYLATRKMVIVR